MTMLHVVPIVFNIHTNRMAAHMENAKVRENVFDGKVREIKL